MVCVLNYSLGSFANSEPPRSSSSLKVPNCFMLHVGMFSIKKSFEGKEVGLLSGEGHT